MHPRSVSFGDTVFVVILVFLSMMSWYPRRQGPLDLRWDGSVYYVLGTSLAQGKGYSLLNEPGDIRANQYPPLLPLIIAAHQKIARTSDPFIVGQWLKLSAAFWSTFVIAAAYLLLRCFLPPWWARCAALMYLFSLPAYLHFSMLSAELPFTVGLVTFLIAHYRMQGGAREAVAGIAAAAAFLARSLGVVIYAAWIADALLKRQLKIAALRSAAAAVCVLPWYVYVHSVESSAEYRHPSYPYQRADYMYSNVSYAKNMTYIDPFRPELGKATYSVLARRLMSNIASVPGILGATASSYRSFWVGHLTSLNLRTNIVLPVPLVADAILLTIGCVVLGGIILLTLRGHWFIGLYLLGTLAAICIAPWPLQHVRYLSPSISILLLGLFTCLNAFAQRFARTSLSARRMSQSVCLGLAALILCEQSVTYFQSHTKYLISSAITDRAGSPVVYKQLFYHYAQNVAMEECVTWIAHHAKPTDVVAASMAHWVYLRTGLKAITPPLELNAVAANSLLDTVPVRYIIQETPSSYTFRYLSKAVAEGDRWRLVHVAKASDVRVYERVLHDAAAGQ